MKKGVTFASMVDVAKQLNLSTPMLSKLLTQMGLFKGGEPTTVAYTKEYAKKTQTPFGAKTEWNIKLLKPISSKAI